VPLPQSWNVVTVTLWTHERGGLTENDFIVAAKIDEVEKADLISKKPPPE
jgi:4a-hydroxytetrahydrobiopterin dehydratase